MKDRTSGDTLRFTAIYKDTSGFLIDPTSTWAWVWMNGTVVTSIAAMTRVSTGSYYTDWQSDAASHGTGQGEFDAFGLSGSYIFRQREFLFRLV